MFRMQIKQLEYFIDKGVDVIVVIAIDDEALLDVIGRAKNAGIKVIAYDRLVRNAGVDLYIVKSIGEKCNVIDHS